MIQRVETRVRIGSIATRLDLSENFCLPLHRGKCQKLNKKSPIGIEYMMAVDFMIYQLIVTVHYRIALVLCRFIAV
jgi:hypothetical protein